MIRLIATSVVAAVAAALILIQMQGTWELALWEILLVALVLFQYRGIPQRGDPLEVPLFSVPGFDPERLPRSLANAELAVVDATSGYLSPERRLRPALRRVAGHRLAGHGVGIESNQAKEMLGERGWQALMDKGDEAIPVEDLASMVEALEEL